MFAAYGIDIASIDHLLTVAPERDASLELPAKIPRNIPLVRVKRNCVRGEQFCVLEGGEPAAMPATAPSPASSASASVSQACGEVLWVGTRLPRDLMSQEDGARVPLDACEYMSKKIKRALLDQRATRYNMAFIQKKIGNTGDMLMICCVPFDRSPKAPLDVAPQL